MELIFVYNNLYLFNLIYYGTFLILLCVLSIIDMITLHVPLLLLLLFIFFGFLSWYICFFYDVFYCCYIDMPSSIYGFIFGFLLFYILLIIITFLARKFKLIVYNDNIIGYGDLLILAGIGSFLGWEILIFIALMALIQVIIVYLMLILFQRCGLYKDNCCLSKGLMPFIPFLSLSTIEFLFYFRLIL